MKKAYKQGLTAMAIILVILLIDQLIKIYVKTHFVLHESYEVTSWFYISFIENNGMAYGMELGSKLFLTLFRLCAVALFVVYLVRMIVRHEASWSSVCLVAAVIAGAIGNIIDCVFYGQWFTDSYGHVAQWADPAAGLLPAADWFNGRVVDMFYFPLIHFNWPDWVPQSGEMMDWGFCFAWPDWLPCSNEPFLFFKPVFNFADACICVGVFLIVLQVLIENYRKKPE